MCPNINSPRVMDDFNRIIIALKGQPMTEDEFKDSNLRNQRKGTDYSAMQAAYAVWDMNNGNDITSTPTGEQSRLYSDLVAYFGTVTGAISAKTKIYSKQFQSVYGSIQELGEPSISRFLEIFGMPMNELYTAEQNLSAAENLKVIFGDNLNYISTTSDQVMNRLISNDYISDDFKQFARLISKISIPVKIGSRSDYAWYEYSTNTIYINPQNVGDVSTEYLATTMMHELVHAYTVGAYNNPQNSTERQLKTLTDNLYNYYRNEIYPNEVAKRAYYGLKNPHEFIAETMVDVRFINKLDKPTHSRYRQIRTMIRNFFRTIARALGLSVNPNEQFVTQSDLENYVSTIFNVIYAGNKYGIHTADGLVYNIAAPFNVDEYVYEASNNSRPTDTSMARETDALNRLVSNIQQGLDSRIRSMERYRRKNVKSINSVKSVLRNVTDNDALQGISSFLNHVTSSLQESVAFVSQPIDNISSKALVQLKRDYIGFYRPMVQEIIDVLHNSDRLDPINTDGYLDNTLKEILSKMSELTSKYDYLLREKTIEFYKDFAATKGLPQPELDNILNNMDITNDDIYGFMVYVGMNTNVSSDTVRIVTELLRNTNNRTKRNSLIEGKRLINQFTPLRQKYGNNILTTLQEETSDGKKTGYFIRDINYGQYKKDYADFTNQLSQQYGFPLDANTGLYLFPDESTSAGSAVMREYRNDINNWLSERVERKYTKEYYALQNGLSNDARDAMQDINYEMDSILNDVMDDNGEIHLEYMDNAQWSNYQLKLKERQNLSNRFDENGNEKTGVELRIALELQEFYNQLGRNLTKTVSNRTFERARDQKRNTLSEAEFKLWEQRNTVESYDQSVWDYLDQVETEDAASAYQDAYEARRDILRRFRKLDSLQIDAASVGQEARARIKELDILLNELRNNGEGPRTLSQERFDDAFKVVLSNEYVQMYNQMENSLEKKEITQEEFQKWYDENHYDRATRRGVRSTPISIWSYIQPRDASKIIRTPSRQWAELDPDSNWRNKKFDIDNKEYYQPKPELYHNKQWDALMAKPDLKAYYDELIKVMQESNDKIAFQVNPDEYKLPQIHARAMTILRREDSIFKGLLYNLKEQVNIKEDDTEFIPEYSRRPDNSPIKNIPTRYLTMLEDTNRITTDVLGSIISFYEMAENYKNKSEIAEELEMVLYSLENKTYTKGNKIRKGKQLNEYKKLEHLLDIELYGKKKDSLTLTTANGKKLNFTKALSRFAKYVRMTNLSFNFAAIGANFLTAKVNSELEAMMGRYYTVDAKNKARLEYVRNFHNYVLGWGSYDNKSNSNKVTSMMQYNGIALSNEETFGRLDNNRMTRFFNNHFWYGGYSAGDFAVKSQIMLAMYFDTKLVTMPDGTKQFMRRNDYLTQFPRGEERKRAEKIWKNIKQNLYDAYDVDNTGIPRPKSEFAQYINEDLENLMRNTANNIAEKADGMMGDIDKAKAHTDAFGQFLMLHRNFMIVGLHDRFKTRQRNYATGLIEEGMYRSNARVATNFWKAIFNIQQEASDAKKFGERVKRVWNDMDDVERYNARKMLTEIANFMIWGAFVSALLVPWADDDREDWFSNAVTYLAVRTAFEFRTLYSPMEFVGLIKSPTAAINVIDYASSFLKVIIHPVDTFNSETGAFSKLDSGAYEG